MVAMVTIVKDQYHRSLGEELAEPPWLLAMVGQLKVGGRFSQKRMRHGLDAFRSRGQKQMLQRAGKRFDLALSQKISGFLGQVEATWNNGHRFVPFAPGGPAHENCP